MLKEYSTIYRRLMIVADLGIVTGCFFLGYFVRDRIQDIYPLSTYISLLPVVLIVWGGLLYFLGLYRSFRTRKAPEVVFTVFKANLLAFIIFASYTYLFKLYNISRTFIFLSFTFAAVLISLEKVALIRFFRYIRKKGLNTRNILLVGTGKRAQRLIDLIHKRNEWGMRVIGLVDKDASKVGKPVDGHKVIGSFEDMPNIIHNNIVDEVIFVVPRSWLDGIEKIIQLCESEGKKASVAVDYFNLKFAKAKQTDLGEFPLLSFERTPDRLWHLLLKRIFDVVVSATALILLSPFFLIISILIKATSKGPVFFRQRRCGLNGRVFTLYKFRTMVQDAEEKLNDLLKYNEMNGPVFKMGKDPRLTKVGRFLRLLSIDEFPQLWNVLKGDMSLVGPRPPIPKEVQSYDNWQRRRLSMRPGITCIWQTNGRNEINDFGDWAKLDLDYIDHWSLGLDFKILARTITTVLFAKGAK